MDWFISQVKYVNWRDVRTIPGGKQLLQQDSEGSRKKTWIFRGWGTRHLFNQQHILPSAKNLKKRRRRKSFLVTNPNLARTPWRVWPLKEKKKGWPLASDPSSHLVTGQNLKIQIIYRASNRVPQGFEPASIPRQEKAQAAVQMPVKKNPLLVCNFVFHMHLCAFFPMLKNPMNRQIWIELAGRLQPLFPLTIPFLNVNVLNTFEAAITLHLVTFPMTITSGKWLLLLPPLPLLHARQPHHAENVVMISKIPQNTRACVQVRTARKWWSRYFLLFCFMLKKSSVDCKQLVGWVSLGYQQSCSSVWYTYIATAALTKHHMTLKQIVFWHGSSLPAASH